MAEALVEEQRPYFLTIHIPFPTHRLAKIALGSLSVDEELSSLVKRTFQIIPISASTLEATSPADSASNSALTASGPTTISNLTISDDEQAVLEVYYTATTPRMLRVAVNGFFESLGVIVQVMEELDVDVLHEKGIEGLEGVQGVEQGMTGTAVGTGG